MTVLEHVGVATNRLANAGLARDLAAIDAEVLARHILGWTRATYLGHRQECPPAMFAAHYETVLDRRARREPVALITGHREFWGLEFEVTPEVLIPRPETELLVEEVLVLVGDATAPVHIVDVGTGSGCLAVALASELPAARVTATDVSEAALAVARRNAARHAVDDQITWLRTRFLADLAGTPDLIVANPPYIAHAEIPSLPPDVLDFEPRVALVGGSDGLDTIRRLLSAAAHRLVTGGHLVIEFGAGQDEDVQRMVDSQAPLTLVRVRDDLQGIPRAAVIRHV